jgi:hypothetical protein
MSGILDNKTRVLDTIVTLEGRRQIASADLKIEYVSFTDGATYYAADLVSGSRDATARIYLEHCSLPQDQITFEADDSGRLQPFGNGSEISVKDGQILSYSFNALTASILTGSSQNMQILRGEEFASTAGELLSASPANFDQLRIIGTKDKIFEDDGFGVGNKELEFIIHDERPLPDKTNHVVHIDNLESLFQDVRLSNLSNFKYLPPINRVDDINVDKRDNKSTEAYHLGSYKPWGRTQIAGLTPRQLEHELQHYEKLGYSKTIVFEPTSRKNTLLGQFFEINFSSIKKLDIIEYGQYSWKGSMRHAFFVGKVMIDGNGNQTFIHIFTLIFG